MKNQLIQYLPLTRPRSTLKILSKLNEAKVNVILDLEDSAQDIFNLENNNKLKLAARDGLRYIIKNLDISTIDIDIFLRVNSIDSEYFQEDIRLINSILKKDKIFFRGIFLPKVKSFNDVKIIFGSLDKDLSEIDIVPMIETKQGLNNLSQILSEDKRKIIKYLHFGHFDYCLDANIWPFVYPNNETFWSLTNHILEKLDHNIVYIHTPFPFPKDEKLFWASVNHLERNYPDRNIMFATLNVDLSMSKHQKNMKKIDFVPPLNIDESIDLAKHIVSNFGPNRAKKRSFSVIDECFIPPHQYLAAVKFLDGIKK